MLLRQNSQLATMLKSPGQKNTATYTGSGKAEKGRDLLSSERRMTNDERQSKTSTMLSEKMQKALNDQINAEIWSAYLYLSMSAYFESENLPGFANWMKIQWQEELSHSIKFFDYVNERGGRVTLQPIAAVDTEWKNPLEVFEATLKHEQHVSSLINELVNTAMEERDHATNNILQWFIAEQVEEEASVDGLVQQLKLIDGFGHGILMLDRELGQRVFVDPSLGDA